MFNPVYANKLKKTTEEIYAKLQKNGYIEEVKDEDALSAAICLSAGIRDMGTTSEEVAPFFETKAEKIDALLTACELPPKEEKGEEDGTH